LSSLDTAVAELNTFLSTHISLIIIGGDFEKSTLHIESANILCLQGPPSQAVLWIKEKEMIEKVSSILKGQLARFSSIDFDKVLAMAFKKDTDNVVYIIEKNPSSRMRRMAKAEMFNAFAACTSLENNSAQV